MPLHVKFTAALLFHDIGYIKEFRKMILKKTENTNAQGRRCSGAVEVSTHKNGLRPFFSQGNAHAQGNGPQNRGDP